MRLESQEIQSLFESQISHKSIKILLAPPQLTILTFGQKKNRITLYISQLLTVRFEKYAPKSFYVLELSKKNKKNGGVQFA